MHTNPPDEVLRRILADATTIAVVGASSDPAKASHQIMRQLQRAGYRVIPVNPREASVLGEMAYASLDDIGEPVDIVDVFRRAEDTPPIAEQAVRTGARVLWLQQGIASDMAATIAAAGGLQVVMDACIASTHARLHVPRRVG
ncbi:MAG: CoA-binding protein [Vicinamibacterales bacterium]